MSMKMSTKAWIALGLLGLVLIIGMYFLNTSASAYTKTPMEQMDWWYGNDFNRWGTTSQSVTTAGSIVGEAFRCPKDFTADNMLYYVPARVGTWTSKGLRYGIMDYNMTSGFPTWWRGGAANYKWTTPPSSAGWVNLTLPAKVSLTGGNMYAVMFHDNGSILSGTVYVQNLRFNAPQDLPLGMPPLGHIEEYDKGVWRLGTANSSYLSYEAGTPWLLYNASTKTYIGQPYQSIGVVSVYNNQCYGTNFTWNEDNSTSNQLKVLCRKAHTYLFPNAPLFFRLYSSFSGGYAIAGGVLCYPLAAGTSTGGRWSIGLMNHTVAFVNGTKYFLKIWSNCTSATYCYQLLINSISVVAYNNNSFQGASAQMLTSINNGSSWTNTSPNDIQFAFNKIPLTGLVISQSTVNSTMTVDYSYHPESGSFGEWFVYPNSTGTTTPIHLSDTLINCVGSLSSYLNLSGYWVNSSHTGTFTGDLLVDNPNPGYGGFGAGASADGSHGTNFIKKAGNLTTSLDINFNNFTTPPQKTSPSVYYYNDYCGINISSIAFYNFTDLGNNYYFSQSETFTSNITFNLSYIYVNLTSNGNILTGILNCYLEETNVSGYPNNVTLANGNLTGAFIPNDFNYYWVRINMSKYMITSGVRYAIVLCYNSSTYEEVRWGLYWTGLPNSNYYTDGESYFLTNTSLPWVGESWTNNSFPPFWVDFFFKIYGTINYSRCLNISWFTNCTGDGHWYEYANSTVVSNSTVTVPFPNASGVGTYYWKAVCESNHTVWFNTSVFSFTTRRTNLVGPSTHPRTTTYLLLGMVCASPLFLLLKKKKKKIL